MEDYLKDDQILAIARLMKSISHPIRFKILCLLQDEEASVGDLRERLNTTGPNISQHLNILRNQGIIDFRKDANYIYNHITDERIIELIATMRRLYFTGAAQTPKPRHLLSPSAPSSVQRQNKVEP